MRRRMVDNYLKFYLINYFEYEIFEFRKSASRRDRITTSGVHYFSNNSTARRQLFLTYVFSNLYDLFLP